MIWNKLKNSFMFIIPIFFMCKPCQAAEYEVLVISKERPGYSAKRGEVVTAQPKGHNWKSGEREDFFTVVPFSGTEDELAELLNGEYDYNFEETKFVLKDTKEEFDKNIVLTKQDAPTFQPIINQVADQIDSNWAAKEPDVCKFLHAKHLTISEDGNFGPIRHYWFKKFRNFKTLPGVREFMACILFRDYGNIAEAGKNLPRETKDKIFTSDIFTKEDIDWMKWTWREK